MHYSCRIKSNRSERLILKVTDGHQEHVSESIRFSLKIAVGLTAEHAEHAEEEPLAKNALLIRRMASSKPHSASSFRVFRVFCGSFAVLGF